MNGVVARLMALTAALWLAAYSTSRSPNDCRRQQPSPVPNVGITEGNIVAPSTIYLPDSPVNGGRPSKVTRINEADVMIL
jgi:hypothetical protein